MCMYMYMSGDLMAALVVIAKALEITQMSLNSKMDKLSNLIQYITIQQKFKKNINFRYTFQFQRTNSENKIQGKRRKSYINI